VIRLAQLLLLLSAAALWGASRMVWVDVQSFDGLGQPKTTVLTGGSWSTALVPLAAILLVPGVATIWTAWVKFNEPVAPNPLPLTLAGLGGLAVNLSCALLLARHPHSGVTLTQGTAGAEHQHAPRPTILSRDEITCPQTERNGSPWRWLRQTIRPLKQRIRSNTGLAAPAAT